MSRYDFSAVYTGLKDFQRATVDYAIQRMYLDSDPARRFLVADEVGLGKTLVARGVIARAVELLEARGVERIDIVYICSNTDIARQNINRLNITGRQDFAFASRITLLATQLHNLTSNRLNFVSFTPGTSFDLKGNVGMQDERKLLYWLLRFIWPDLVGSKKGPKRVFQGPVHSFASWEQRLASFEATARRVDDSLVDGFAEALETQGREAAASGAESLRERFERLSSSWAHDRANRTWQEKEERNRFIGELRALLARTCISALEPDLVILDEFQRFKHLLEGKTDAAQLAHDLFDYSDADNQARVLLLSATPYKMYTLSEESETDDHYADFLRTAEFLMPSGIGEFTEELRAMRLALLDFDPHNPAAYLEAKTRVERRLRRVMCRTERLAVSEDRNGMLRQVTNGPPPLTAEELRGWITLDRVASELEAPSPLELWKSAPYVANFWDGYQIGRNFQRLTTRDPERADTVRRLLAASPGLLSFDDIARYHQLDPGNARLRWLLSDTIEREAWKLLWLAPSLPYHRLAGPFATPQARHLTKRLVFSSWAVVPRAVSAVASYEAERRMMAEVAGQPDVNSPEARAKISEPLQFPTDATTGMTSFAVVYPSPTLARLTDPLRIAAELASGTTPPSLEAVLASATRQVGELLERRFPHAYSAAATRDRRWYWAAPLLLDAADHNQLAWLRRENLPGVWPGPHGQDPGAGFRAHLDLAREAISGRLQLGAAPEDLAETLALIGLAAPGNVALRSLWRLAPDQSGSSATILDGAAHIAWAFRSLFNTPEVTHLIRRLDPEDTPYWQKMLRYSADGCLQSVLDEYTFVLREWLGILEITEPGHIEALARQVAEVVSLRSADLTANDPVADAGTRRLRCRFALPFGQYRSEEAHEVRRSGYVRAAFNSPFWPFILTTTSIGQEGLDFHLYCHAVVHWNLPANPVDLEQREGRVHRYMGHAVRKNLAYRHGHVGLQSDDPWPAMLEAGRDARPPEANDLVPYWIYPGEATIERHIPALPLSKEIGRAQALRRSLSAYRLLFGQPRQEDLAQLLADTEIDETFLVTLAPGPAAP